MKIVGCDLHTRYQQIAMLDDETVDRASPGTRERRSQGVLQAPEWTGASGDRLGSSQLTVGPLSMNFCDPSTEADFPIPIRAR